MSRRADVVLCRKQDWPHGRRVYSRTTHAAMNSKSQASCLFCQNFSAQFQSLSTPKECTICDEMHLELLWCENCSRCACLECCRQEAFEADYNNHNAEESESGSVGSAVFCLDCGQSTAFFLPLAHQTQFSECDSGFREMIWCESCRTCTLATNAGSVARWLLRKHPHHPALSPIPLSAQGGVVGKGWEEWAPTSLRGVLR